MKKILYPFIFLMFFSICFSVNQKNIYLNQIENNIETLQMIVEKLNEKSISSSENRNVFIQNVLKKDKLSDDIADIISKYFLQKAILPGEKNISELLGSSHKIMNLCFKIKGSSKQSLIEDLKTEFFIFKKLLKEKTRSDYQYKPYKYKRYKSDY